MIDAGILQQFPVTTTASSTMATTADVSSNNEKQELANLDTVLDAIARCATAPELALLYMKMTGSKKHVVKTNLMAAIRKVAKTQRRIDGSRIPVAQLMQEIWLESYPLAEKKSSDVMVLRMTPATQDLILRMHRLFYVVSTPPFNATSMVPPQLEDVGEEITGTEDKCVVGGANAAPVRKVEDKATVKWQMRSWEQFYTEIEKMESLDDLVLASRGCLQTFLKWMKAAAYSTSGIPIYFYKCNAGYHLVRVLHTAVGLYEKMRKYQIATLLLNELLAAPYLERKRGYWWDRLALNLEHLKCADQARDTCANALKDPHVLAADRIALERRLHRLQRREYDEQKYRVESLIDC
ncbi:unnamed protein product [Peronospora destructor]|uniref:Fanconi-associated nuclease n=1 Tax=Peronospora destructor TaxID=86335 RepID=A0AAV0UIL6_9STRA|nr:unnamed protein product [Peronospora destructor]